MGEGLQEKDFQTRLAEERPRLVRLCAWFTGSAQTAEDLAQETLLAAWRNQSQLSAPDKLSAWLSAIARNVCLNWSRQQQREGAHRKQPIDVPGDWGEDPPEAGLRDEIDLELDLDRAELARLLEQALTLLPAQTAQMLVEHYIRETPHAEIAEKLGVNTGAVAVRLQRGRQALQRLLSTRLQEEAAAFGLLPQASAGWEETNIWCTNCGQRRLLGQFQRAAPDARFVLRCPRCHPDPQTIMVGHDLTRPYYADILGSTRMYKPAYTRLISGLAPYYHRALHTNAAACLACGQPGVIVRSADKRDRRSSAKEGSEILIHCPSCGWETNTSLNGLAMALPEAQRFWRENPRMRALPVEEVETQGLLAYVTRLQSLTGSAELAVISRRDTLAAIAVHSNTKL